MRERLDRELANVIADNALASDFTDFIINEIYASYKRGIAAGKQPRKKAFPKKGKAYKR